MTLCQTIIAGILCWNLGTGELRLTPSAVSAPELMRYVVTLDSVRQLDSVECDKRSSDPRCVALLPWVLNAEVVDGSSTRSE
jgi:hypothetical protein